jgi:hypothetical protein
MVDSQLSPRFTIGVDRVQPRYWINVGWGINDLPTISA